MLRSGGRAAIVSLCVELGKTRVLGGGAKGRITYPAMVTSVSF